MLCCCIINSAFISGILVSFFYLINKNSCFFVVFFKFCPSFVILDCLLYKLRIKYATDF